MDPIARDLEVLPAALGDNAEPGLLMSPVKASQQWYHPLESPSRYPLELHRDCGGRLAVSFWFADGKTKYVIALMNRDEGGCVVRFIGDRPLREQVNWDHFRELLTQGISLINKVEIDGFCGG